MEDFKIGLTFAIRLANLLVVAYLFSILAPLLKHNKKMSFSKTLRTMLVAIVLFFIVEIVEFLGLLPQDIFQPMQTFFTFVFLVLLVAATLEIKKGLMAHDHLMRRRLRQKQYDVE